MLFRSSSLVSDNRSHALFILYNDDRFSILLTISGHTLVSRGGIIGGGVNVSCIGSGVGTGVCADGGIGIGSAVGSDVGSNVGAGGGSDVGADVGICVGSGVGSSVGDDVGAGVGSGVGAGGGVCVGTGAGSDVGVLVGIHNLGIDGMLDTLCLQCFTVSLLLYWLYLLAYVYIDWI